MSNPDRSYGQGALGAEAEKRSAGRTALLRLRNLLDDLLTSRPRFIGALFIIIVLFAIVMTGLQAILAPIDALNADATKDGSYFETFWETLSHIVAVGGDGTWGGRVQSVLFWAMSISVTATVVAFVTTWLQAIIARLGKGISPVLDGGHILILGWSPRVFPIIKELAEANASERKATVVIFADVEREAMNEELQARLGSASKLGKLRLVTRKGRTDRPNELQRANILGARSIIVLDNNLGDAAVVSTVLAIKALAGDRHAPIVAELDDPYIAQTLATSSVATINAVRSHDIIARVTGQAARQPGLAAVVLDLLDFDGSEVYFTQVPELVGKTYREALLGFSESSVIGLQLPNGQSLLNPAPDTIIPAGGKIILVAEDDSTIAYQPVAASTTAFKAPRSVAAKPENILVIGWSAMGRSVIDAMSEFLPAKSNIHIIARKQYVDPAELGSLSFTGMNTSFSAISGDVSEIITVAEKRTWDSIIILGYRNAIARNEADAQTLLTMMQMQSIFADSSNSVSQTRIVAEILDSSLVDLARVASNDDIVVSDVLAALLMAQISENADLAGVLGDLFDGDGARIELAPIERFAPLGEPHSFAELVRRAGESGYSVFGYRYGARADSDPAKGVVLNVSKLATVTPAAGDALVVVGGTRA